METDYLKFQMMDKCPFCHDTGIELMSADVYINFVPEYANYLRRIYGANVPPGIEVGIKCRRCGGNDNSKTDTDDN